MTIHRAIKKNVNYLKGIQVIQSTLYYLNRIKLGLINIKVTRKIYDTWRLNNINNPEIKKLNQAEFLKIFLTELEWK